MAFSRRPVILVLALMAGCTADGVGFDDPEGEVSVIGDPFEGCEAGSTYLFGKARNTGDVLLGNITAIANLFDGAGRLLGSFEGIVSGGIETVTVGEGEEATELSIIIDTLGVDESGTFEIATNVGCGRAASVVYSFDFTVSTFEEF